MRVQGPIVIGRRSEPQPDVAVLRPCADYYATRHPGPRDVLLLVEVSDTTGGYDRAVKLPLYARGGIPEVWIVDLRREMVEVYRGPTLRSYRARVEVGPGQRLVPAAFPKAALKASDVFG